MPSTYTPDPLATQAPATAPTPDGAPDLSLPIATEPRTISSILQAFKALGDWTAWLMTPRARSGQWAEAIRRYRTALLHTRFAVDHLGFPTGPWFGWEEVWPDGFSGARTAFNGLNAVDAPISTLAHWYLKQTGSGSLTDFASLGPIGMSAITMKPVGSSYSLAHRVAGGQLGAYRHVVFEAYAGKSALDATRTSWIGMGEVSSGLPSANFFGFRKVPGSSNWQAAAIKAGVLESVDTGVAVATGGGFSRLRAEYHGGSVSEDSNERIRYYVNGEPVATASLQIPTNQQMQFMIGEEEGAGSSANTLAVGPVRFRANYAIIDAPF